MDILHSIYRDSVCGYVALGSRAIQTCSIYYSFTPYTVSVSPHLARKPELSRSLTNFLFGDARRLYFNSYAATISGGCVQVIVDSLATPADPSGFCLKSKSAG